MSGRRSSLICVHTVCFVQILLKDPAEVHDIAYISMIIWDILFYSCTLINMIKEWQTTVVIFIVMPSHVQNKQSCDCSNSLKLFSCMECMSYFVLYTWLVLCHWLFLKYHIRNLLRCLLFVKQTCVLTKQLHHEEDTDMRHQQDSKNTAKVKQLTLSSSTGGLSYHRGHHKQNHELSTIHNPTHNVSNN